MKNKGILLFNQIKRTPKKELIFFDKIYVPNLEHELRLAFDNKKLDSHIIADLEYLATNDLIREISFLNLEQREFFDELRKKYLHVDKKTFPDWINEELLECLNLITYDSQDVMFYGMEEATYGRAVSEMSKEVDRKFANSDYLLCLYLIAYMNQKNERGFIPIVNSSNFALPKETEVQKQEILKAIINYVPLPFEDTPIEQILDFRKDKEANDKYEALKLWIHDIGAKKEDLEVTNQRLKVLLTDYEKYIRLQKLKFKMGFIELVVTTTAETIENLVKLKLSKLAKSLFKLKYNRIAMIEKEMKAPGREVAYISMVNEKFKTEQNKA
ncbi:MAG: hypothetical protein AAF849_21260 [Bacteroidota bacterium]